MPGRSVSARAVTAAAAAVLAAGALAGCGSTQKAGTAALVGGDRITVTKLDQTVRDWRREFRADPAANDLRSNSANPGAQLGGESDSDLRGALTLLINFRVARKVADKAGVTVTGGEVDAAVEGLNNKGGAESVTLASGLPRAYTRDLARLVATQFAVMQRFGASPGNLPTPQTQQAGQRWNELFRSTADGMDIEVSPRYGGYDPGEFAIGPVQYRLSTPDSGI
ncbi:hypothetical protein [Actinomadura chibensis]|uniref:Lipoprotein n=1 Tax=Actinomadura chibensis TaxID=392828 RepID=A0A5D0NQ99_9ACTN|nr:hypothetical protein [Actinomadura chibensis]TYB46502.1 hypothetical protein FXF69_14785 [Actinomadura chibensis]